jgi:Transposase DNA-binding/Transposase DDE domain
MKGVEKWARDEFGGAMLGDPRRTARAIEIAARVAERPAGTITGAVREEAEREAAFRFVRNAHISVVALARSAHVATLRRCAAHKFVFVAIDQSSIGLTDTKRTKDLGRVGSREGAKTSGLQAMTALAVGESGRVLGVCGQRWWRRPNQKSLPYKRDKRPLQQRESSLWGDVIDEVEQTVVQARATVRPWYQLDRGGDAWQVLRKAQDEQLWITVRAAYDRAVDVEGQETRLRTAVGKQKPLAFFDHYLSPSAAKRLGHSPLRPRHLEVRVLQVGLILKDWRDHKGRDCGVSDYYVVHLREKSPPPGVQRLEWFLLTTYPIQSVYDALRVAWGYSLRWRIEEFHKTWKSGACNIERSQLRSAENLKRWATLLAAVASRIERLKQAARDNPNAPALEVATQDEIDGAIVLTRRCKWKLGAKDMTIEQFVLLVANLGGYTGRSSSGGPPGSIVIGRGFDSVSAAATALSAVRGTETL